MDKAPVTGAVIGYARTSTRDQHAGLQAQLDQLQQAGCTRIYKEQLSSVRVAERQQLEAAIDFAREGDVFVVTKIDRLARSLPHLLDVTASRTTAANVKPMQAN
jgi:DNA invertase Pin-like site-specific DNA recombinase